MPSTGTSIGIQLPSPDLPKKMNLAPYVLSIGHSWFSLCQNRFQSARLHGPNQCNTRALHITKTPFTVIYNITISYKTHIVN